MKVLVFGTGVKKFMNMKKKSVKEENHLMFLCKFKDEKVTSNGTMLMYSSRHIAMTMKKANSSRLVKIAFDIGF